MSTNPPRKFWMVFHPKSPNVRQEPTFRHLTYISAEAEARRLTGRDQLPSYILEATQVVEVEPLPVLKVKDLYRG